MPNFSDWLIVGSVTFFVGATSSFVIPGGGASGALLGSTTGAVVGAAISSKRQDDKQRDTIIRLKQLEEQLVKQEEWKNLNTQLPILKAEVDELRKHQRELAKIEGKFVQKREELQQFEHKLTTFNQQKEELEQRIAVINQQKPDLSSLEQLQVQIQQFKLGKSGL